MNITINTEQSQYVKTFVEGCSTWGFQNAFDETALLAERLGHPELAPFMADYGTEEVLKKYAKLIKLAAKDPRLGTWFKKGTPDAVKKVIDRLIHTGEKVRVFYGDRVQDVQARPKTLLRNPPRARPSGGATS